MSRLLRPLWLLIPLFLLGACTVDPGSGGELPSTSCSNQNGGCGPHETCDDSSGSAVCSCDADAGYTKEGSSCTYDPCLIDNGGCGAGVSCTSSQGEISCGCPSNSATCPVTALSVPATSGTLSESYDVTIDGMGSGPIGSLTVQNNTGAIEIDGVSVPIVAYEQILFAAANETLYQFIGAAPDHWVVGWAYCNGGLLNEIWYETTDGTPVTYEMASGSCVATNMTTNASVSLPATRIASPSLLQGYSVTGTKLSYTGAAPGTMSLSDDWDVYPFNDVNCWTGCGTPGWYEMHSLLWETSTGKACFGIFYLIDGMPDQVPLEYTLCLPDLDDPTDGEVTFQAAWSH